MALTSEALGLIKLWIDQGAKGDAKVVQAAGRNALAAAERILTTLAS